MSERPPCPEPLKGCKYDPPFADTHHEVWPGYEYTTPTEKKYRNLECNIVRGLCRCLHDLEHLKKPPRKPTIEVMRQAIDQARGAQPPVTEPAHWSNWIDDPGEDG